MNQASNTDSFEHTTARSTTVPDRHAALYNMNHKKRGLALIFNQKTFDGRPKMYREGTDEDRNKLCSVLKQLDFEVSPYDNLSYQEILKVVEGAAAQNHEDHDCLVVCILSHGEMGYIFARDTKYKLADICRYFAPDNCPTLAGKPKLFFVQACQGNQSQGGIKMQSIADDVQTESYSSMGYKIPLHADFLIAYSTIPGYLSWRNPVNGSWFIQSLCAELQTNGKRLDLISLLTCVCRRVAINFETSNPENPQYHEKKQIPCVTTMLTRILIFSDKPKKNSKLF